MGPAVAPYADYGRGVRISFGLLVYVIVGCVVAAQHNFFDHLRTVDGIVSAALAVILWPLVLLGVHARI
jgi:hypothetical protein